MSQCRIAALLGAVLLFFCGSSYAVNYTLPASTFAPCQSGWNGSSSCSGAISFANGDTVTSSQPLTLNADGGITLRGNTIGSASNPIAVQAAYNTISTANTTASTINGSVINSSGAITLSNVTINGSLQTASGAVTLTSSSVSGSVIGTGLGSLTNTNVTGNVQFNNGVTISGGSFSGTLTSNGNASISGATVAGAVSATNGITATNSNFNGTVTATNGTSSFTGGTINADINGNCCKITISGAYITGTVSNANEIEVNNSSITGGIDGSHNVRLGNSTVYGDVSAASWAIITGTGSSKVYGTCTPGATSPANLCESSPISTCFSDNFDRADLGSSNWAVTSRNGSFGVPKTVGNRLRLTDNTGNVATGATLQRLLPATGNFVQLQFRYYAYNGNGADGVAVIFSDASITPQPGGYGGSLGYAQLNGTSGFAGGWLGIALDEYGNFSSATETRVGGPGLRQDSVSIRGSGSGTSNYRYLAGTAANLSPGLDVSGSTAGPGHLYRITLDSRTAGSTLVSVERNTGSGFSSLIAPFNAQTGTNQASLPSNFFVSLTGSTGGSNNIHELDDFQVCATKINSVGAQIDHFEFVTASGANTCSPHTVTVTACSNAAPAACTPYLAGPVTVNLSSNGWIGGSSKALINGVGTFQLQGLALSMPLGVSSSTPPARSLSQSLCRIGTGALSTACTLNFAQSGFVFDVPNKLANKEASNIAISAVINKGTPNSPKCEPAFTGNVERNINFWSDFIDPVGSALSDSTQKVRVNNLAVGQAAATATAVPLRFNDEGKSTLLVNYSEAGEMQLNATYAGSATTGDSGLMVGSDKFVSRPLGFCVYSNTANSDCATGAATASCSKFVPAGDEFTLGVRAVAWASDADTNLCEGNTRTQNYREGSITLASSLVAPSGGVNATLGITTIAMEAADRGEKVLANQTVSEVGVFTVAATAPISYLKGPVVGNSDGSVDNSLEVNSASANIGRFFPAYLGGSGSANLTPSCGSSYSYQGQPIAFASGEEPTLIVTGYNRQNAVTKNYDRGAFWRLATPTRDDYVSVISGLTNLNSRLAKQGDATLGATDKTIGDGAREFRWSSERLIYNPAVLPVGDDYPVAARVRQGFSAAALTDLDGVCYLGTGTACAAYSFDFGGTDVRLGRLRIDNAHGSELQSLALPTILESWQNVAGGSFQKEGLDTCTTATVLGAVTLDRYTSNLNAGETTVSVTTPVVGAGNLLLSAPGNGNDGTVQARYSLMPSWLYFAWDGATRSEARGMASFGIYKGATPLIYQREIYRQ